MRISRRLASILLAAGVSGLLTAGEDTVAAVRRAIEAGNNAWIEAMKHADAAPIAGTFDPEGVNIGGNGVCQKGPEEIQKSFQDFLAQTGPAVSARVEIGEIHLDGNLAYEWGHSDFRFAPKGPGPKARTGRYLAIWRKQKDGGWKILRNIGGLPQ